MEFGLISVLPPVIAIVLALVTKKVVPSLLAGILAGALILSSWNPFTAIWYTVQTMWGMVSDSWNLSILVFLVLLGVLVSLVTLAGGSARYGEWAARRIKSRAGAQFAAAILGILIFIDDYFNCLTVGTVMRPVTDKFKVSRAKLSYIIDSTAAPICIIAPVSSWVVTVMTTMGAKFAAEGIGLDPFIAFIQLIPMNLYALLALVLVGAVSLFNLDFGPMARHEAQALAGRDPGRLEQGADAENAVTVNPKGTIWDLVVPISGLVLFTIIAMIYTGGYFDGGMSVIDAIKETDAALSLLYGGIAAVIFTLAIFLPRQVVSPDQLPKVAVSGFKSMLPAIKILILAWTIGGIVSELQTGQYLAHTLGTTLPPFLYPPLIFALAAIIAFSTGTSWGTFAIMIPIAVDFALLFSAEYILLMIGAVLAGAVFGDHCSPISDTTILSSTGALCNHIDHVTTQLPYAVFAAIVSFVGYLAAGWLISGLGVGSTAAGLIALLLSVVVLLVALRILHSRAQQEAGLEARTA
ncbi:MAG: Na+/H+ antiporter NhaC family protein [Firmicutes bacterium]|nr:Na+/H+ antiporter NhaC family protein [Bacillota bacterium]